MNARPTRPVAPVPPLRLLADDLGLGNRHGPRIDFLDSTGARWTTDSVEFILRNIDHFSGRHRLTLLTGAALHYGLDAYALMGAQHLAASNPPDGAHN